MLYKNQGVISHNCSWQQNCWNLFLSKRTCLLAKPQCIRGSSNWCSIRDTWGHVSHSHRAPSWGGVTCEGDQPENWMEWSRHVISYSLHGLTGLRPQLRQEETTRRDTVVSWLYREIASCLTLNPGHYRQGTARASRKLHLTWIIFLFLAEVWVFK